MPGLSGFYVNLLHQISLHIFQGHFDEDTGSEWPDYEPIMIDLDFARIGAASFNFWNQTHELGMMIRLGVLFPRLNEVGS